MTQLFRMPFVGVLLAAGVLGLLPACSAIAKKPAADKAKAGETSTKADAEAPALWNETILEAVGNMPLGGGYSISVDARDALQAAVAWEEDRPALRPSRAQPSFCSGATYVVFLVALARGQREGKVGLAPEVWRKLIVEGQADGEGVWGRWNANGPGTARLFHETGAGRNFTDLREAKRGDFLKIFWNDSIGASEKGHSVIFLGVSTEGGEEQISFWSSNQPGGFGSKTVPRSKVRRMVFSRLENPARLEEVLKIPARDAFLAKLEEKSVSVSEAAQAVGLKKW